MPSSELLARIAAAKVAVLAQTDFLHRDFGRVQSTWKSDGSRVTAADIAISEAIFKELVARFPEDEYLSEELGDGTAAIPLRARFAWVLDPIDGTNNYATGIPYCAISLALLENGTPVYGVIYDLARRVLMHGGPAFGAWDGEQPARVKTETPQGQRTLGFHSPMDKRFSPHATLLVERFKIRGLGSSTLHLAYVGAGLLDATVDHNVKVWDIAAAVPFCQGAGGEVRYLKEPLFPLRIFDLNMARVPFVAGASAVCEELVALLGYPKA
ncbi:MAG: inositol monophosphatase [Verrucomicrobia bacterium]|nr:inositol monophosphatase [Verrucomicrobiota bacterium]